MWLNHQQWHFFCAVAALVTAGARVAANHTGSRGLLVVEPISAAAAAAAAGTTAAGAAAAVAHSMHGTSADTVFAADASAAVGVAAVLAAKGALAAAATPADLERVSVSGAAGSSKLEEPYATWAASKLAACLKLSDCLQDAAAAAEHSASSITGWRLVLLAERTPQQLVQVRHLFVAGSLVAGIVVVAGS